MATQNKPTPKEALQNEATALGIKYQDNDTSDQLLLMIKGAKYDELEQQLKAEQQTSDDLKMKVIDENDLLEAAEVKIDNLESEVNMLASKLEETQTTIADLNSKLADRNAELQYGPEWTGTNEESDKKETWRFKPGCESVIIPAVGKVTAEEAAASSDLMNELIARNYPGIEKVS